VNLLAHALVAYATLPDTEGQECAGSLMADYFTGQSLDDYPAGVRAGIEQHRAVDAFTDGHPAFASCRRAISEAGAPRFTSGILADVFWDHVLASDWETHGAPLCGLGLESFCSVVYERLGRAKAWHSPGFARAYPWLVGGSWLSSYARLDGIGRTLAGISSRMSGHVRLEECVAILRRLDAPLRAGFSAFWPELLASYRSTVVQSIT